MHTNEAADASSWEEVSRLAKKLLVMQDMESIKHSHYTDINAMKATSPDLIANLKSGARS